MQDSACLLWIGDVDNSLVFNSWLFFTGGYGIFDSYAIRPVVEIDLTKVNVGLTGDGSSSSPYSIEAK